MKRDFLNVLSKNGKVLDNTRNNLSKSLNKSLGLYVPIVAILGALSLVIDGISTWKRSLNDNN